MKRIILILFIPILLFPEGTVTIKGKVIDSNSKKPIYSAVVNIYNSQYGDATDTNGNYIIENVKPGEYNLFCSVIGYYRQSKIISIDGELPRINIDFDMEMFKTIPVIIPDSLKEYHCLMSSLGSEQKLHIKIDSISSDFKYVFISFENLSDYPIYLVEDLQCFNTVNIQLYSNHDKLIKPNILRLDCDHLPMNFAPHLENMITLTPHESIRFPKVEIRNYSLSKIFIKGNVYYVKAIYKLKDYKNIPGIILMSEQEKNYDYSNMYSEEKYVLSRATRGVYESNKYIIDLK